MAANSSLTTAVHALCWIELARRLGYPEVSSERIAESVGGHPVAVRRLLAQLREAGLLQAGRGRGSGWRMTRDAATVSVLDLHNALGHPALFAQRRNTPNPDDPVGFGIRPILDAVYAEADDAMSRVLGDHTVAELVERLLAEHPALTHGLRSD